MEVELKRIVSDEEQVNWLPQKIYLWAPYFFSVAPRNNKLKDVNSWVGVMGGV